MTLAELSAQRKANGVTLNLIKSKEHYGFAQKKAKEEVKEESSLSGLFSDVEAKMILRQIVEVCTDLYEHQLVLYDLSLQNLYAHM